MKNIFEVNEEEKSRILNLHENATRNQYLTEDTDFFGMGKRKEYEDKGLQIIEKINSVFVERKDDSEFNMKLGEIKKVNPTKIGALTSYAKFINLPEYVVNAFQQCDIEYMQYGTYPKKSLIKIGEHFFKHPSEESKIN